MKTVSKLALNYYEDSGLRAHDIIVACLRIIAVEQQLRSLAIRPIPEEVAPIVEALTNAQLHVLRIPESSPYYPRHHHTFYIGAAPDTLYGERL